MRVSLQFSQFTDLNNLNTAYPAKYMIDAVWILSSGIEVNPIIKLSSVVCFGSAFVFKKFDKIKSKPTDSLDSSVLSSSFELFLSKSNDALSSSSASQFYVNCGPLKYFIDIIRAIKKLNSINEGFLLKPPRARTDENKFSIGSWFSSDVNNISISKSHQIYLLPAIIQRLLFESYHRGKHFSLVVQFLGSILSSPANIGIFCRRVVDQNEMA